MDKNEKQARKPARKSKLPPAPPHPHEHGPEHPEVYRILPDGVVERIKDDCD